MLFRSNVTANQFSTGKLFPAVQSWVNRSMEEKVIVAVCDSRGSIDNSISYNIIVYIISRPTALSPPDGGSVGSSHRDWASRGLFTCIAMVSGLVCSNGLLGRPI